MCLGSQLSLTRPESFRTGRGIQQSKPDGDCIIGLQTFSNGTNVTLTHGLGCQKLTCKNSILVPLYEGCLYEGECYSYNLTFQGIEGDCFLYRCVRNMYYEEQGDHIVTIRRATVAPLCKDINGHCWKNGQTFTGRNADGEKRLCRCDIRNSRAIFYKC